MPTVTAENIYPVLDECVSLGASDVQLKTGQPPLLALHGEWRPLPDFEPLLDVTIGTIHEKLCKDTRFKTIPAQGTFDADYRASSGRNNFRVSVGKEQGRAYMVMRPLPREIPNFHDLKVLDDIIGSPPAHTTHLHEGFEYVTRQKRGLVLVTGPTGSGKSTTLASLIDHVNQQRRHNIITIEDPIEFVFRNKKSNLLQREVGVDTESFGMALRAALRQKPDIILVGEMRDKATIDAAFRAAATGHLVISTLHNNEVAATVERIINEYEPTEQTRIRHALSEVLVGIFAQQLVPNTDGGRQVIHESLVFTPDIRSIIRPKDQETGNYLQGLRDAMRVKNDHGNRTMDDELQRAADAGLITEEIALEFAIQPDNWRKNKK